MASDHVSRLNCNALAVEVNFMKSAAVEMVRGLGAKVKRRSSERVCRYSGELLLFRNASTSKL